MSVTGTKIFDTSWHAVKLVQNANNESFINTIKHMYKPVVNEYFHFFFSSNKNLSRFTREQNWSFHSSFNVVYSSHFSSKELPWQHVYHSLDNSINYTTITKKFLLSCVIIHEKFLYSSAIVIIRRMWIRDTIEEEEEEETVVRETLINNWHSIRIKQFDQSIGCSLAHTPTSGRVTSVNNVDR